MKVHEYLKIVEEQIRCKSIWEDIRMELLGHIEEDTEYFRRKGMSREEAVERAVEEMGDPVETGIELDKVHRTRLDVKLLLFFIGIDLLTVVLAIAYFKGEMLDDVSRYMLWRGTGLFFLLMFSFGGYRKEYFSKPYQLWLLFFIISAVFMMISVFGGAAVEDSGFHLTDTAYQTMLFSNVAGFGGLAFYYRKGGYGEVRRLLAIAGVVCLLSMISRQYFFTFMVVLAHVIILTIAVRRGWFRIKRREFLIKLWSLPGLLALLGVPMVYRAIRDHRIAQSIRKYLDMDDTPGMLLRLFGSAGILGIFVMILLIIGVFLWMLYDIRKLTNQYCNIICTGVLTAFSMMVLYSLLAMMGFGDISQVFFPFFLSTGSAMGVPSIFIIFFWGHFFICTGTIRYCLRRSCPRREQLDCAVYGNGPGCSERDIPGCFFLTGD